MPPVRTKKGDGPGTVRKEVEFVAKDADEQVASGIAMVPDKADLQRDFAREDTIRAFADQFDTFEEAGEAGGGIMHAVFPDEWMTLERNEVIDEAETIGGTEAPAGAWVQDWSIENDEHWGLIEDGILEGYSIGAIDVRWDGPFEQGDDPVDDVDTPEEIGDDPIWELIDGIVREVSTVDIPAVPDAQILETKADAEKRLGDYLGDQSGFIEEALDRGHTEAEAERMWDVLNDAADVEGSGEPGKQSVFAKAGRAFLSTLSGSDDDGGSEAPDRGATKEGGVPECWVCGDDAEYQNGDPPNEYLCEEHADPQGDRVEELAAKEGRTLSTANRDSLMASIDASLDVLQDAGVDHGMTRFTDKEDVEFDLTEHSARTWAGDHGDDEEDGDDEEEETTNNAAGGETPDGDGGQEAAADMTNDNDTTDPWDDAPEWARDLRDDVQENSEQIDDALEADADGDTDADDDGAWDDAPEWAKALKGDVDENAERIDTIVQQSGAGSQQVDSAAEGGDENGDGLEGLGKALS